MSRTVKELVELGLVDARRGAGRRRRPPAAATSPGVRAEPAPRSSRPAFEPAPSSTVDVTAEPSPSATRRCSTVVDARAPASTRVGERPLRSRARSSSSAPSFGGSTPSRRPSRPTSDDDPADAAEIARQLANLSPKAAKAVAAAAKATTQEEREAALAEVDDDEEPINRGLLLKFLGSVNG